MCMHTATSAGGRCRHSASKVLAVRQRPILLARLCSSQVPALMLYNEKAFIRFGRCCQSFWPVSQAPWPVLPKSLAGATKAFGPCRRPRGRCELSVWPASQAPWPVLTKRLARVSGPVAGAVPFRH